MVQTDWGVEAILGMVVFLEFLTEIEFVSRGTEYIPRAGPLVIQFHLIKYLWVSMVYAEQNPVRFGRIFDSAHWR